MVPEKISNGVGWGAGGGGRWCEIVISTSYLSNTPTNLCIALLNFLLFCFILYCYAFVQYCYVK